MSIFDRVIRASASALNAYIESKEEQPPPSPEVGKYYSGIRSDYAVDMLARRMTPARIGRLMRDAEEGSAAAQYEVFETVEQDPKISRLTYKRRLLVTGKSLKIIPANETPQAEKAVDLCNELVLGLNGWGGIDNWTEALFDLTDAIFKGVALSQIVWENDGGRWIPRRLERWPQREIQFGDPMKMFAQDQDQIRLLTENDMTAGEPLQPHQWITHIHKNWSVPLARCQLARAVTWYAMFKRFSMQDWTIFNEKYGIPMRMGKYAKSDDDAEKTALWNAVKNLGRDGACVLSEDSTIELIESSRAAGALPFPLLIDHCDDQISVAIMGNTMSTTQGDRGARSAKEAYKSEEDEQTQTDCLNLAKTLRRDLAAPIVGFNLGWDVPVPRFEFLITEDEDLLERAKTDDILVNKLGVRFAEKYVYEKYDRPEPEDGADLLPGQNRPVEEKENDDDGTKKSSKKTAGKNALTADLLSDAIILAEQKKKSLDWVTSNQR